MALRINTDEIQRLKGKNIFLDTNIWIYLFCPLGNSREFIMKKYSRAFKHLISSENRMFTDITVLSEFINRFERLAFDRYKTEEKKGTEFNFKKDYKRTSDFKEIRLLIKSTVNNKILKWSSIVNIQYEKRVIEELINHLGEESIDFNDLHIEKLCREKNLILLTDDGDYTDSSIDIISGNPKLAGKK